MFRKVNFRFVAIMAIFMGIVLPIYRDEILGRILAPFSKLTAQIVVILIHWSGQEAVRIATLICHPDGFVYEISYVCTGFLPIAFLIVAILSYSADLRTKALGLAAGVFLLLVFNLMRLVHLFYLGIHKPAVFDLAHSILWHAFMILAVLGLWFGWTRCAFRRDEVQRIAQSVQN